MTKRNVRKAACAPGVVQGRTRFSNVGDPVFQLNEDVGAVIDTQTIARAQVLVDPHVHVGKTNRDFALPPYRVDALPPYPVSL